MAVKDVKSTGERIAALKNAKLLIDQAIRMSQMAQKFHNDESVNSNIGNFKLMWDGVKARIEDAKSAAETAVVELQEMTDNGFVYQYTWEIGKRGVTGFVFEATADTITVTNGGSAIEDSDGDVLVPDDYIRIEGTSLNNTIHAVFGAIGNEITCVSGIVDETCTTRGAKITLIRRGN